MNATLTNGGGVIRRLEGNRLVYYWMSPTYEFWDQHWKTQLSQDAYFTAQHGELGWIEEFVTRYMPREGRILEAGCGMGQHVMALRFRGYDVEGVEWSPETVKTVLALYPNLPIREGDVTCVEVPDGYYSGYVSLGVMEHRQEGPEPFLREAYRVLNKDGIALISVPFFLWLRKIKALIGLYDTKTLGRDFYQYAFEPKEFSGLLKLVGFEIIDRTSYDVLTGVGDEIPLLHTVFKWRGIGWRLKRLLRVCNWTARNLGHMMLFACKKPALD